MLKTQPTRIENYGRLAIVALGIPVGVTGIIFGWLNLRQYLKILERRGRFQQRDLALQERELILKEGYQEKFQEKELEDKFKLLATPSSPNQKPVSEDEHS